jgi:NAD(P)H-dependent flavin oxidoreductase YrpB (nitropropane dioxygenase family)
MAEVLPQLSRMSRFHSELVHTHTLTLPKSYGAVGVWVGTRFVASVESGAPPMHKELIVSADFHDVIRTAIYSGRPMNVRRTPYVREW